MVSNLFFHLLLIPGAFSLALPSNSAPIGAASCTNPRIRKSWHGLTVDEKQAYLKAVECLYQKPPQGASVFPAVRTRHDDIASLHIQQTTAPDPTLNPANKGVTGPGIHFNGVFLPWHRYAVWTYESILINECGYNGAQPFWDWTLDTSENNARWENSPIFDPVNGFGGNSRSGSVPAPPPGTPSNGTAVPGDCIGSGPFAASNSTLGPGFNLQTVDNHCIIRNFDGTVADGSLQWQANVYPLLENSDYWTFSNQFDNPNTGAPAGIHGGGHGGVGGEMRNVWSSINDPLFFMHHAQIDHVWAIWQDLSPSYASQIGGPYYPNGTGTTTAETTLLMESYIAPDIPISQVMDTLNQDGSGILCYQYETNPHPVPASATAGPAVGQPAATHAPVGGDSGKDGWW